MSSILQTLVSPYARSITGQFLRKTQQANRVQRAFLLSLVRRHQSTEFGRRYQFNQIRSVEEFLARVPVLSYRDHQPYTEKIARGESNVLTSDLVVYMNMTSGSTGQKKLIPVTARSQRMRNKAHRTGLCFGLEALRTTGRSLGKILVTSAMEWFGETEGGIPYGPVSANHLRNADALERHLFAHPYDALAPSDNLARHYVCLLFALNNPNTRFIGANFPVLALQLAQYLEAYADSLIDDLERGTIAPWLNLEPHLRSRLERQLSPTPQRARQLRQIRDRTGRLTPILAWPDLSLITTALGGTSDFYLQRFPEYFGDIPVFGGIYSSSETAFGIYRDFNDSGSILAIESGFFEFVPSSQWNVEQPTTLLAEEVQIGQHYRILITNYNGLYRYDIGDVVEVVGFCHKTPVITFRHRRGGLLSSTSEKTTEFHAIQVMKQLQQDFDIALTNFCITLSENETPPSYLVNIELVSGQTLSNPDTFLEQFDRHLQEIHTSYAFKRQRNQIPPPRLRVLASGSFDRVRQRLLQRGIPEHHLKFPHISEDRQFLTGVAIEQEVYLSVNCSSFFKS
ncbi:GH3 auxin-responsive promoter family protein [Baaleninema simplex]|uniref:GH3 auxin-responsive promoter family protein n=1 Tax=Baaleninema simplex TaxID=2862350 RepID=UPI00034A3BEC|nr:GH3 auxin-responsive promoter family protein [Baaleninema simplex]